MRLLINLDTDGIINLSWSDVYDTFDGYEFAYAFCPDLLLTVTDREQFNFQQKGRDHGKFYVGKFHQSVHHDWHTNTLTMFAPPNSANDCRNADYQWWYQDNLRHTSSLNANWDCAKRRLLF